MDLTPELCTSSGALTRSNSTLSTTTNQMRLRDYLEALQETLKNADDLSRLRVDDNFPIVAAMDGKRALKFMLEDGYVLSNVFDREGTQTGVTCGDISLLRPGLIYLLDHKVEPIQIQFRDYSHRTKWISAGGNTPECVFMIHSYGPNGRDKYDFSAREHRAPIAAAILRIGRFVQQQGVACCFDLDVRSAANLHQWEKLVLEGYSAEDWN